MKTAPPAFYIYTRREAVSIGKRMRHRAKDIANDLISLGETFTCYWRGGTNSSQGYLSAFACTCALTDDLLPREN